jgi:hypothetical protein
MDRVNLQGSLCIVFLLAQATGFSSCSRSAQATAGSLPGPGLVPLNGAHIVPGAEPSPLLSVSPIVSPNDERITVTLPEDDSVRYLKDNVLEIAAALPKGTRLSYPKDAKGQNYDYRDADGTVHWSSNFYYPEVRIEDSEAPSPLLTSAEIFKLNATPGGLYVSSVLAEVPPMSWIPALVAKPAGDGFLAAYREDGKPKLSFTKKLRSRFGDQLNRAISMNTQSPSEQRKWWAIYGELKHLGDRTRELETEALYTTSDLANRFSIDYEETGVVQKIGAWSIAVLGTAPRHGFSNVPCAEFMSEMIRHAYVRAGYHHQDDFNDKLDNPLIWSYSAAVTNLAEALYKAGWIPWEAYYYQPMTGAPMMNEAAQTPGHAYMTAGEDGRFIVDNGSPKGRDLRATSAKIIEMMYHNGVFFLPPGIIPHRWP